MKNRKKSIVTRTLGLLFSFVFVFTLMPKAAMAAVPPQAKIMITFDDGWKSVYTKAYPILQSHGYPATAYVNRDLTIWDANDGKDDFMDITELKALYAAGWDISNHTTNHLDFIWENGQIVGNVGDQTDAVSLDRMYRVYKENQNWLLDTTQGPGIGDSAYHVAYPSGLYSDDLIRLLKNMGVMTGRAAESKEDMGITEYSVVYEDDLFEIPVYYLESNDDLTDVKNAIAAGGTIAIMLHKVQDTAGLDVTTTQIFTNLCTYIAANPTASVITMSQWYAMQNPANLLGTTPAAPSVTGNDEDNTVTGLNMAMEYKLDDATGYSPCYIPNPAYVPDIENGSTATAFIPAAMDLSGNHTLYVRYKASGKDPAGADKVLTFSASQHTVFFEENGGTAVSDQTNMNYGAPVSDPGASTKTGYTLNGWYTDNGTFLHKWDFATDTMPETDLTLNAKWVYTVTFDSQGGSPVASAQADPGATIVKPADPTKEGFTFAGWYKEAALNNAWDFASDTVTMHTTLYSKWAYSVAFDSQGGSPVASVLATPGTTIAKPADPTKEGYTFAGWHKEATFDNVWEFAANAVTANNTTLFAKWTARTYTVLFDTWGADQPNFSVQADFGTKLTVPADPTKPGYTFAGWYKEWNNINLWDFAADTVAMDTNLYAKWAYKVTFDSQGGSPVASVLADPGTKIAKPADPTKEGYTFAGWYKEATFENAWDFAVNTVIANNTMLYAKWTANTYTVAYDANGGSGTTEPSSHTYGAAKALTANGFAKTGYTFAGWNTNAEGTGTDYANLAEVTNLTGTNGATVTLYVKWTANAYTVAYDANGGTGTTEPSAHTYDAAKVLTANGFVKTGYSFAGWNTMANGSGTIYADLASVTNLTADNGATVTFFAQWTANAYTVVYDSNGGLGTMDSSAHVYDAAKVLTANGFAKTGYAFEGWNTMADGSGTSYAELASVTNLASDNNASVTLFAQWTANTYTVAYDNNGGSGSMVSGVHTYDAAKALTANGFTKTGYSFAGWNTKANGSGTGYAELASVTNLASENGASVTLFAQWTINHYTVAYDGNGGSGAMESSAHTYDAAKTLTANGFARTGYTFAGWNTMANGSGTSYAELASVLNLTSDNVVTVTLFAQWTINHYTVTFKGWDGDTLSTQSVPYGSAATAPAHPDRTGYTAAGWDVAFSTITDNLTVTALYSPNGYTVAFDAQGGSAVAGTSANYNTTIAVPSAPTRDAFAFSGWFKEPGCINEWSFSADVVTGNTTLFARWSNISAIKVQSSSSRYGSVLGVGNYANDRTATVTALPKNGYYFVKWMNGRALASTDAVFTFPAITNMSLKAYFASIPTPRFKVAPIGYSTVKVSWSLFYKASGYTITRSTSSRGIYTPIATVGSDVSSYIDANGLVAGKTYYYKVTTICTAGATQTSRSSSARSVRPNWPTVSLRASLINYHTANLSWKTIAEADGYKVLRSTSYRGIYTVIADVAAPTLAYQDAGLEYGHTYYYKVLPYDTVGADTIEGTPSSARYVRPSWPTVSLRASVINYHTANLSWKTIAGADGYKVLRSTSYRGAYIEIADVAAPTLAYQDPGLEYGRTYYYKVLPYDVVGADKITGSLSSARYVRASWPTMRLQATATAGSIGLSWNTIVNADGYEVERSLSARSGYAVIADVTALTCADSAGLTPGTRYYYKVRPYDMVNGVKVYGPYCSYKYATFIL